MKRASHILGEIAILALLAALLMVAVLWQPFWIWIAAPLVMLSGFIGIVFWAKPKPQWARLLVFLCPISYTVWLVWLGASIQSGGGKVLLAAAAYYALGAGLLWGHQLLNAR